MAVSTPQTIALQVGSELRLTPQGDIKLDNPTVEVENIAAEAVISLAFDPETREYVIRLVAPFAIR